MRDIAIFGAGGFGREVACIIGAINSQSLDWNFLGFFDDSKEKCNEYGVLLGGMDALNNWSTTLDVVIAIGNPDTARLVYEKITNKNIYYPNIIAPDCLFFDKKNVNIGKGNIISFGCSISCNVCLGDFNILNGAVTIGHDASIGNFNSLMPGVRISGFDIIGGGNFFGVSSVVLQGIKIENNVKLGANSVLMKEPKSGATYLGNPARPIF